jgi:hypothetical protein
LAEQARARQNEKPALVNGPQVVPASVERKIPPGEAAATKVIPFDDTATADQFVAGALVRGVHAAPAFVDR